MNDFLKAVMDGDVAAAKTAFNQEMHSRCYIEIENRRKEISAEAGHYDPEELNQE